MVSRSRSQEVAAMSLAAVTSMVDCEGTPADGDAVASWDKPLALVSAGPSLSSVMPALTSVGSEARFACSTGGVGRSPGRPVMVGASD
jgi:hypothetical protein